MKKSDFLFLTAIIVAGEHMTAMLAVWISVAASAAGFAYAMFRQ